MKHSLISTLLILALIFSSIAGFAADDPSIKGAQRNAIRIAMDQHIRDNLVEGRYLLFDTNNGQLKKLNFDSLHTGIVKKADFFVSCADFKDSAGKLYDVDFLVIDKGEGEYRVVQSIVHAVDGNKRPYHVEG